MRTALGNPQGFFCHVLMPSHVHVSPTTNVKPTKSCTTTVDVKVL